MIEIKDLLSRFNSILLSEEEKLDSISRILSEAVELDIKKEKIKIKNNVIYLDVKPIYKNEIFLKQEHIFTKLKEAFGKKSPKNIR